MKNENGMMPPSSSGLEEKVEERRKFVSGILAELMDDRKRWRTETNGFTGTRYLTPEPGRDVGSEMSADVERDCPLCHTRQTVTISWKRPEGIETWHCHGCGGRKRYRVS